MVRLEGLEPSAYRLKGDYSTTELQPHKKQDALLFKFHSKVKDQLLDASLIVIYNLSALLIFSFFKQSSKENKSSIF